MRAPHQLGRLGTRQPRNQRNTGRVRAMREAKLTSGAAADTAFMPRRFVAFVALAAFAAALNIALVIALPAPTAEATDETYQQAWVVQASTGLQPPVIDALHSIVGVDRRLLAVRSYLRAGDALSARWSWSQEQLSMYSSTPEGKAAAV